MYHDLFFSFYHGSLEKGGPSPAYSYADWTRGNDWGNKLLF